MASLTWHGADSRGRERRPSRFGPIEAKAETPRNPAIPPIVGESRWCRTCYRSPSRPARSDAAVRPLSASSRIGAAARTQRHTDRIGPSRRPVPYPHEGRRHPMERKRNPTPTSVRSAARLSAPGRSSTSANAALQHPAAPTVANLPSIESPPPRRRFGNAIPVRTGTAMTTRSHTVEAPVMRRHQESRVRVTSPAARTPRNELASRSVNRRS